MAKVAKLVRPNGKRKKPKTVRIELDKLALLCLNVDYTIEGDCKDNVEDLSVELQKKFKFDTHKFRLKLDKKGVQGAV